jgi:hypothetical protein
MTPHSRGEEGTMSETMWKIIDIMRQHYLKDHGSYWATWKLQKKLGIELEGCGINGDPAITRLVELGLIEELPDLHCRYRIVIK